MSKSPIDKPILNVRNLSVSFKNGKQYQKVLHDVSFEIYTNEFVAVVGESGSGKSVTARVMMGLLPHTAQISADVLDFNQQSILRISEREMIRFRGSDIAMIFQEPMSSLNPTIACGAQVAELLKIHTNLSHKEIKKSVLQLFTKVRLPHPEQTYYKYPHEISGGQMQRVMIAMAIACQPTLLIADEPTTALDVTVQQEIISLLKDLQQEYGMSVLFISHDLGLVRSIADRILVMYKGVVVEQGTPDAIFNHAQQAYTRALIAARPDPNHRLKKLPTIDDFLNDSVVHEYISVENRRKYHEQLYSQSPLIQVKHVVKDYPLKKEWFKEQQYFRALDDISLTIYPNESLGLVGESGCGKSTLGNCILGLRPITSGEIWYKGMDIVQLGSTAMRSLRKELQIIFQDPFASLNPRLTVGQAIIEPMAYHGIGSSYQDRKQQVLDLLEQVGLSADHFDRYPHEFSGGQRQRIGIARTIALQPTFIVCDESVSALDISVQAQVLNLLNELKDQYQFSYLFISHDLAVVKYFCDRVVVMNKGRIEEYAEADQLYQYPNSTYTQQLIAAIPS